jgi:Fe2+ or Zn2+ uptake regulation protein
VSEKRTEKNLLEIVRSITFSPLKINFGEELVSIDAKDNRADFIAEISWKDKFYKFIVEVKRQATPKIVEEIISRKQSVAYLDYLYNVPPAKQNEKYYYLLIAPYLNEEKLERLAKAEISGIDLSGNGLIIVPNELFVYRFGEKNKFPSNAPIKNVFRGTSSIIPRVFFARPEYKSVTEVLEEIISRSGKTTIATVSKVLKTLEENLLISRKETVRLVDGRNLLQNLRENYQKPTIEKRIIGKAEDFDNALIHLSENSAENNVLYAIDKPRRYAVMGTDSSATRIYTESISDSLGESNFTETSRFPNLEVIQTSDQTVYFDRRYEIASAVYYTSPLQVYLELAAGGKR